MLFQFSPIISCTVYIDFRTIPDIAYPRINPTRKILILFIFFYCPYTLAMRCDKNNPFIIYLLNITTMMLSANGEIILPLFIKQQNLFIEYQNLFI